MEIEFKNIGFIKSGSINTNQMTIIFGPNNVGKTYLSYSTYAVLKKYSDRFSKLPSFNKEIVSELNRNKYVKFNIADFLNIKDTALLCDDVTNSLSKFFKDTTGIFSDSVVKVENDIDLDDLNEASFEVKVVVDDGLFLECYKESGDLFFHFKFSSVEILSDEKSSTKKIKESMLETYMSLLLRHCVKNELLDSFIERPFIITSERTGISLFLKEIDGNRNNLVDVIATESIERKRSEHVLNIEELFNRRVSKFSEPINHNINVIRDTVSDVNPENFSVTSFIKKNSKYKKIIDSLESLVNGSFVINKKEVVFSVTNENGENKIMPLSLSSASNKSLFLLDLYIRKYLTKNAYLIIDEPELNLHPKNQVKMAELLVRLANFGVKVVITTHSDYLVKEINNRIMGSKINNKKLLESMGYGECDVIGSDKVNAFTISDSGNIEDVEKNNYGVNAYLFDNVIIDVDERAAALYSEMNSEKKS